MIELANSELDELTYNYKELGYINEKQEKRVQNLETETILLVTSYIIFQGIIFHSISQPSNISCNFWWIPFSLSLLIAVVFGLAFISTITKWGRMQDQYEVNLVDRETLYYKMFMIKHHQKEGIVGMRQQLEMTKPDVVKVYQRQVYIWIMFFVLLSFTIVILHACSTVLCNK